jgi:putative Holliday junction resolvase
MSYSAPAPGADHDAAPVTDIPPVGRVLGLDLGSRRIGVAASDSAQTLAIGTDTVERSVDGARHRQVLAAMTAEYEAVGVVIGLPLSLDGGRGPAATATLEESDALRSALGVPVTLIDERLTTVAATSALRAGGHKGRRHRAVVDRTAATIILQSWLDRRRAGGSTDQTAVAASGTSPGRHRREGRSADG